jgi:hypothetical protein
VPPTWFLILMAFCAGWAANTSMRIFMGHEVYIGGQKANRSITAAAVAIILVAVGIMAAILLGLIPDHAP